MPKKKAAKAPPPKAELIARLTKWPKDWIAKIDLVRGEVPFSEFIRQAVAEKIGAEGLSQVGSWGGERRPPSEE